MSDESMSYTFIEMAVILVHTFMGEEVLLHLLNLDVSIETLLIRTLTSLEFSGLFGHGETYYLSRKDIILIVLPERKS